MKQLADKIYVISLPERTDRRQRIQEMFAREEIAFEFVDGVRVASEEIRDAEVSELYWAEFKVMAGWDAYLRAAVGCKRAHIRCLENALEQGVQSLLIFEDDVAFREGWYPVYQSAVQELPKGWLQLYFSALNLKPAMPFSAHLERLSAACQTTAILYSMDGMEAALQCVQNARSELDWWMGLHLHPYGCSYLLSPQLTYQTGGYSDCQGIIRGATP